MKINYNPCSLIDILGLVQSILLGGLLLVSSRERKPFLLLGLFILTFGLELLPAILEDLGILKQYPFLMFLPLDFHFFTFPAFYLYAKSLTQPISIKGHWQLFIPAMIEFLALAALFFLPASTKLNLLNTPLLLVYDIKSVVSLFFNIYYAYLIVKLVNQHQSRVVNYFSETTYKMLTWVKLVAILLLVYMVLWIVVVSFGDLDSSKTVYAIMSAINVIFIFWLALVGFKQSLVYIPNDIQSVSEPVQTQIEMVGSRDIEAENKEKALIFEQIKHYVEKEKPYTNPQLSLADLAEQLKIPQRTVSTIINEYAETNFSQFINQYRVEEAKLLINDPKFSHLNMLGIAFEVGFNSKTSFFTTFKKMTGTTPTSFHKK